MPAELTKYLSAHRDSLYPDLRARWAANGDKTSGSWAEVFGDTVRADEIFMAWHYARFIQSVAAQGKAAYNIPMYVNTWLAGMILRRAIIPAADRNRGWWMCGRPQAPRSTSLRPISTTRDFITWCRRYHRAGNPLYMPETRGGEAGAANVFYALGEEAGLGFSPFGIDDEMDPKGALAASYHEIETLAPMLLEHQSAGDLHGFVLDRSHPSADFTVAGYTVHVTLDEIFGNHAQSGFGLLMPTGPDEFLGAGKGFRVTFTPRSSSGHVGIAAVDEGAFVEGKWMPGRRLNGDENDQGKAWRFDSKQVRTEKVTLYHFN